MEKLSRKMAYKPNEEILEKMRTTFYSCPTAVNYCRNLGVPDELIDKHIDILYDFARDINYCKKCPGIDNCIKENPLLCTKIVYEDGFLDRQLSPCRRLLEKMRLKNQFLVMDFDEDWINKGSNEFNKSAGRKKAMEKYAEFAKKGDSTWIYLTGEQNTGRSYVAAYMAIDIAKKEKGPVAFINTASRFRQLSDMNYKKQELFQKTLDLYCTVPVLVLDDFGNELKNDFVRDAILFEILSKRSANHLFTIFTSDFVVEDIETLYGTTKAAALRAKQIAKILKGNIGEGEINLGDISIY